MAITAGVDEAGRGPLAGPVVASAVILPDNHSITGLNDSKKLSSKKRNILFEEIMNKSVGIGVGIIDEKTIDKINILNSTHKAMQTALNELKTKPDHALIDGFALPNHGIPNDFLRGGAPMGNGRRAFFFG